MRSWNGVKLCWDLCPFKKSTIFPSYEDTARRWTAICKQGQVLSSETGSGGILRLDFPLSELGEKNTCYVSHPVHGILLQKSELSSVQYLSYWYNAMKFSDTTLIHRTQSRGTWVAWLIEQLIVGFSSGDNLRVLRQSTASGSVLIREFACPCSSVPSLSLFFSHK